MMDGIGRRQWLAALAAVVAVTAVTSVSLEALPAASRAVMRTKPSCVAGG